MVTAPDERLTRLHTALLDRLDAPARSWLTESLDDARADGRRPAAPEGPTAPLPTWELRFAAAGRRCTRREPPHTADPEAAEAARVLLLHAARADARTVTRLYAHGTAAERRAVLGALPYLTLDAEARPSSRTRCGPTTPGWSPPPSGRTPRVISTSTPGGTPS